MQQKVGSYFYIHSVNVNPCLFLGELTPLMLRYINDQCDSCVLPFLLACLAVVFTGNVSCFRGWYAMTSWGRRSGRDGLWDPQAQGRMEGLQLAIYFSIRIETRRLALGKQKG